MHFHEDIKGYLFLSVKHRCLNHLKKQKTQYKEEMGYIIGQDEACLDFADELADYHHQLQKALDSMPGQKRTAIQMVYIHGKRYQDAADTMNISINSLKTHLKTGLKFLRGEINSKMN
jgi:RNA polymerase sigma factor (sigma-70 family)